MRKKLRHGIMDMLTYESDAILDMMRKYDSSFEKFTYLGFHALMSEWQRLEYRKKD